LKREVPESSTANRRASQLTIQASSWHFGRKGPPFTSADLSETMSTIVSSDG